MAYLEITGLPMRGSGDGFDPAVNLSLEQGRGLSVLSDNGVLPRALSDALIGTGPFIGEIYLNGVRIDPIHPRKRSIRVLGKTSGIIPHATVRENMELALRGRAMTEGEAVMMVERELSEGALAGMADARAGSLDSSRRTILAATRALFAGCDLLLITSLPVPGGRNEVRSWRPGSQLDALLDLKGLLRRLRATWISLLSDSSAVHVLSDRIAIFSGGTLTQEGGLRECISAPSSRLVADFLAFPRMNYRTVRVERDGPFIMMRSGRYGFHVSEFLKRAAASREGEEVVFGIRAEDLGLRPYEKGDPTVLNLAKVRRVDVMPGALIVYLDMEGDEWVALTEPDRPFFTGQLVELRPDPDKVHLFHAAHGSSLLD